MSKIQITYVYGSNIKSRSSQFQNQNISIPIPGDTTPNKHGITNAQSILKDLGALGNAGMFIFMGYIPHGPGWTDRACEEGDILQGSPCVRCIGGNWGHLSTLDPCPGWHQVQDVNGLACDVEHLAACKKCGPCLTCISKNGEYETNGEYECIDDWTEEELEEFRVKCIVCEGDPQGCHGAVSPLKDTCEEKGLACCNGTCYDPNTQCTFTNINGECEVGATCEAGLSCCHGECYDPNTECTYVNTWGNCEIGCFHGETCVDAECVDDPAYVQSLVLKQNLVP